MSPGLLLLRGMVASSVHSSFPSQRAASIGKGFFFFLAMGGGGDALEGRGGVSAGLMLSWGLVRELIESILINLISKLIHERFYM